MKAFATATGLATVVTFVRDAAAQAAAPPPSVAPAPGAAAASGNGGIMMALALMAGLLILVGIGVKIWDARRRREAEAVHLQSQISDALLREQDFFGLAITPTVHGGMRRGSAMTVDVTGQAPTESVRDSALRIVRSEIARTGANAEIVDRIDVRPMAERRVA